MRNQLLFLLYFLATVEAFAGGSTGIGPPGSIASCMANAIVVEFGSKQQSCAGSRSLFFREPQLHRDGTGK